MDKLSKIVNLLIEKGKVISTMESCTGGYLASSFTDVEGSSSVFKYGAVTYCNEFKVKMGVDDSLIDKYSVYSMEVARDMSKKILDFTGSNYGIGITGKLNRKDENNDFGEDNKVFISIYDNDIDKYYDYSIIVTKKNRRENKELVVDFICDRLLEIIK